eukprot:CAMPEP_0183726082 /NCGR_PEP_ID=MMETSP0737-20130205/22278_1 /TAXON_ID=385413 /ORGANISM="Thalassiosira miniscula, Strain CCMP1093" /LENGTH=466 /DNA_ID=CAMNT_0025957299 /DNA_START=70 /DNA_END=1470 /DNA_ORIENTATION=+
MPQEKIFQYNADEIEHFLPADNFKPSSGNIMLAIASLSKLIGGHRFSPADTKRGLERLCSKTITASAPLTIICNIRRWALQGLKDERLLSMLREGRLKAPDPPSHTELRMASVSRSITAKHARCVLANAFIGNCIDIMAPYKDPWNAGGLDFGAMLRTNQNKSSGIGLSKMECLLTYFDACSSLEGNEDDNRRITFDLIRFVPLSAEYFASNDSDNGGFVGLGFSLHTGTMEHTPRKTSAFVNFANPNYGYGKFISSCTQEEILLMCCPELIVGMLFIGKMDENEVVNVRGIRRFCKYSGYLDSFKCEGPLEAEGEPDVKTILTLDACYQRHFTEAMLWRDLSKAYFSFLHLTREQHEEEGRPVVSTGKWGCGAFGGSVPHKLMQQAVAARGAGVDIDFSSFGGYEGCDKIIKALHETKPSVAGVIGLLQNCKDRNTFVEDAVHHLRNGKPRQGLISVLGNALGLV